MTKLRAQQMRAAEQKDRVGKAAGATDGAALMYYITLEINKKSQLQSV
jgi:hypothetical protein